MSGKKPLLAFFGHHKCATMWVNSIIRMVCRDLNFKFVNVDNPGQFERKLDSYVKDNNIDFLSYTNANMRFVRDLDDFLGFHVIRDPRDIVVSAYFLIFIRILRKDGPHLPSTEKNLKRPLRRKACSLQWNFSSRCSGI